MEKPSPKYPLDTKLKSDIIILAAGNSTRMGSPKALLKLGEKTLLELSLETISTISHKPILVLGNHAKEILGSIPQLDKKTTLLINPNPERGQFSSLQLALKEVTNHSAFVLPLDTPAPKPNVWLEIEQAAKHFWVVAPKYQNKGGHPVWISQRFIQQLMKNDIPIAEQRLDVQIKNLKSENYCALNLQDPSILVDLDTPNDRDFYLKNRSRL